MSIPEGAASPSLQYSMPTQVPELISDRFAAYPLVIQARQAAERQDLAAMAEIFRQTEDDPALQNAACWEFAEVDGIEPTLRAAAEHDSTSLSRLLLAIANISIGWSIRSGARAQYVSEEQWTGFRKHLCIAEPLLIAITAAEPNNVLAWNARLATGRGLSVGTAEVKRRYHQLSKHNAGLWQAQRSMLQQLCPKWSGSFPEMLAFVREAVAAAPPGSVNPALIVEAYVERTMDLSAQEEDAFLVQPEVREEIDRAAAASVLHPDFRQQYGWVAASSLFAAYYTMVEDREAAAPHIRALGPYLDNYCIYWWPRIEGLYQQYRVAAFGGAQS